MLPLLTAFGGKKAHLGDAYDSPSKLRTLVREGEPEERIAAAKRLAELNVQEALPDLLFALRDREGTGKTCRICKALGSIGQSGAIPDLRRVVDDPQYSQDTKKCAIDALGSIGGPEAAKALRECIERGVLATRAIQALGRSGDRESIPFLENLARNSVDPVLKRLAAQAIRILRGIEKPPPVITVDI